MAYRQLTAAQLRVTIADIEPPIWRQLVVPLTWDLGMLHLVIQAAFNWWNYHMHEFRIGPLRFGPVAETNDPSAGLDEMSLDETSVRLLNFGQRPVPTFHYTYDFGDDWRHSVEIEEFLALDLFPRFATCVDGARARPPEDVGGVPGYEEFLEVMADRRHDNHRETKAWAGGHFDPEWFDLALINKDLKNALKPNVQRRLYQSKPNRPARC